MVNLVSRGGDSTSQGGITSATTAIGNQDGISHENRSGHSGHDNSGHGVNQHSAGMFGADQSHKSISDRERTPTNRDASGRQDAKQDEGGVKKDPYYFTFFNEKNEKEKGEVTQDEVTEQTSSPKKKSQLSRPQLKGMGKKKSEIPSRNDSKMQLQDQNRESQNKSQIARTQEEDSIDKGYLQLQKQVLSTNTPQKDMNQIKSKFSQNDMGGHGY